MGAYSMERLNALAERFGDLVKEVRGVGLMIGVELKKEGMTVVKRCMEKGLLLNCTQEKVLRFMPPLNVGKKHIDEGIAILEGVLKEYQQE
jgi:acetylornithine/succinyldiaminopimelate/putrescine aminotransferase